MRATESVPEIQKLTPPSVEIALSPLAEQLLQRVGCWVDIEIAAVRTHGRLTSVFESHGAVWAKLSHVESEVSKEGILRVSDASKIVTQHEGLPVLIPSSAFS